MIIANTGGIIEALHVTLEVKVSFLLMTLVTNSGFLKSQIFIEESYWQNRERERVSKIRGLEYTPLSREDASLTIPTVTNTFDWEGWVSRDVTQPTWPTQELTCHYNVVHRLHNTCAITVRGKYYHLTKVHLRSLCTLKTAITQELFVRFRKFEMHWIPFNQAVLLMSLLPYVCLRIMNSLYYP